LIQVNFCSCWKLVSTISSSSRRIDGVLERSFNDVFAKLIEQPEFAPRDYGGIPGDVDKPRVMPLRKPINRRRRW
jgi:hypothetical protein